MPPGPDDKLLDVHPPARGSLAFQCSAGNLSPAEARFISEYTRSGDMRQALETADYHPSTDAMARDMANEILRKVNEAMDCRDALNAAGMGTAE